MASTESQTASPNKAMNGSTPATKGARGFEGRLREVAALYTDWTIEEESVTREWHRLFADLEPEARQWLASFNRPLTAEERETGELARAPVRETRDALRAALLVRNYRIRGHFAADLDPLKIAGGAGGTPHPDLDPETYGFEASDHERPIFLGGVLGFSWGTLGDLLARLRTVYCGTIGAEFMHIQDPVQRHWWYTKLEHREKFMPDGREQKAVLESLIRAEEFEQFLNRRFAGTKRFGLDGAESVIPATEQILRYAARAGVEQAVIGMPHRGRLNVLAHVMEKPYVAIFSEFSGGTEILEGSGDVKYHLGTSTDRTFDGKRMHLSLAANPSHLEAVNPVVLGKCRAKQRQLSDTSRTRVLPILFHGDAAFAGQGLVAETLDFSDLGGYRVGGTIHIIVNNQIGFTTNPVNSRSGPYCSDIAKATQSPILHVNGDDPEAVFVAARLALEYRQRFHRDVVLDIFCYRRFGHNEIDEPSFTQPKMYETIGKHPSVTQVYAARLEEKQTLAQGGAEEIRQTVRTKMEGDLEASAAWRSNRADWLEGAWSRVKPSRIWGAHRGDTAVPADELQRIGATLCAPPEDFALHPKLRRFLDGRKKALQDGDKIDWALGEALAFATLVAEGHPLRMSGQDCRRGTFSQRHIVFVDQKSEADWNPLLEIASAPELVEIIDSPLSEMGVLGYEYGYSLADPEALVVWEAQFGDFANGAQVILDQFISSSENKWLRMSGLVMLLPHGFEGQGPEHSSARPERFLQLCAEDNMQILNCTTPASYFHALRRQLRREIRKPLMILTPKSLLRDKRCVSTLDDFAPGSCFHRVLLDAVAEGEGAKLLVFCSGKVFYDLTARLQSDDVPESVRQETGIVRLEQIYPWPSDTLQELLARHKEAEIVWCQEEPRNMGAWFMVNEFLEENAEAAGVQESRIRYAGRKASASVATGLMDRHQKEQQALVAEALMRGLPRQGRIGKRREQDELEAATAADE